MVWGKEWPKIIVWPEPITEVEKDFAEHSATAINAVWQNAQAIMHEKIKAVGPNVWSKTNIENGEIKTEIISPEEMYTNLKPTHDPYTNPNAYLYYECSCGAILDPNTKSFAALNNHASEKGWKIRFTDKGYVPYCVKCGEGVE